MNIFSLLRRLSSFQIIVLSFALLIGSGTLLLMTPWATQDGQGAALLPACFTAVSASCVTGLTVVDTASYWSHFGQFVILMLIQVGGLGVVTMAVAITVGMGQHVGLMQRSTMQDAISAQQIGGIVRMLRFVLKFTAGTELLGACLLLPVFARDYGWLQGGWMAVFHSISAFCNAGFDLMGPRGGGSLMVYAGDPLVNLTIMGLIMAGGLGFLTWADLSVNRLHWRRLTFQTRIILMMTVVLVAVPALVFFTQEPISGWQALFQSVTTRTAGFNTMDIETLSEGSRCIMVLLMMTGGAPGSTAGGIKTTTAFALLMAMVSVLRMRGDVECQSRRIPLETVRQALAIFVMYALLFFGVSIAIGFLDHAEMIDAMVEVSSALGTVGLSIGLTEKLSPVSQVMLMLLMYFGRVGALTMIYALHKRQKAVPCRLPEGKLTVG
ncbi:TrkH family potassium uptake protein [Mitsuokella multacida]|uniref:TrkH family potassium uptake protein n=1 Tax=Mitsuokella multacida TaxID=52226 RepID=UPI002430BC04|nr:potassium transporter TrkG [Mitsuokella multacida]